MFVVPTMVRGRLSLRVLGVAGLRWSADSMALVMMMIFHMPLSGYNVGSGTYH